MSEANSTTREELHARLNGIYRDLDGAGRARLTRALEEILLARELAKANATETKADFRGL